MYSSRWPRIGIEDNALTHNLYVQTNVPYSISPPLNNIPNSVGAYSVRLLRTAYTGFAVNLRRSSDNAQTDVSFDLTGQVSGNSSVSAGGNLTTWAGASNLFVATWYDQSGGNFNLTQSTAANQYRFILNGGSILNGKPTLLGITSSTALTGLGSLYFTSPGNFTHSMVFANPTASTILFQITNTPTAFMFMRTGTLSSSRMAMRIYNTGNALNFQNSAGSPRIGNSTQMSWIINNSTTPTIITWQNANLLATETSPNPWSNTSVVTPIYILGQSAWTGNISEILLFSRALSSSEIQQINISQKTFFHTS